MMQLHLHVKGNMKTSKHGSPMIRNILAMITLVLLASHSATAGPTNDWSQWSFKRVVFLFSNAPLYSVDGHSVPAFSEDLFDDQTRLYLYGESDGKVYGVGTVVMQTSNREAIFNLEAKGSMVTKGKTPFLSFSVSGDGVGSVNGVQGEATFSATFTQARILTNGIHPFDFPVAEGTISGYVKQDGATKLRFQDTIKVRLDAIADHGRGYLTFDFVDVNGRRLIGHSHGTNNCFGRYEHSPVEMLAKGSYGQKTGTISVDARGLGHAEGNIRCEIEGKLQSANPGERIDIKSVTLKGKAYGQKLDWTGIGAANHITP